MTIEEAIKHEREVAEEKRRQLEVHWKYEDSLGVNNRLSKRCEKCAEEHEQVAEWLEELKYLRKQTRWIPVTERLPEENNEYLVTIDVFEEMCTDIVDYAKDLYKIDKYDFEDLKGKSGFYKYSDECGYYLVIDVVAWMPLPHPYKEEGAEE